MKNKKGSHVGLVLSFVLFITFLIFIYQVLVPSVQRFDENSELILSMKEKTIDQISEEVYSVRINDTANTGVCIKFNTPDALATQIISLDDKGVEIPSIISGSETWIEGGKGFVTSYYGDNFTKTQTLGIGGCVGVTIGNVLFEKRILEKKIIDLVDEIGSDYDSARIKLDVSGAQDFDVQFIYSNGTHLRSTNERELKTNIYSKQFMINYLGLDSKEEVGELIIKIW